MFLFHLDHGDHLGQHQLYQKMEMYEPAVRIPLLLRVPGAPAQTVKSCVSHLDVMPTLMDLLGVDKPDYLEGVTLADVVRSGKKAADRTVFGQYSGCAGVSDIRRAAITRRWKYVFDPDDAAELYDLDNDPLEMKNLAGDPRHAKTVDALHAECKEWHESHGDWVKY